METHPDPSEPHEQQTKRRRYRVPRSCDRCRASKIKCVFRDDQCTACATARVPCTFANPGSLSQRPPTQKDIEHLQARIRSLERLIHAIDPAFDFSSLPEPSESQAQRVESNPKNFRSTEKSQDQFRLSASPFSRPENFSQFFLETHDPPQSDPALTSLFFPRQQLRLNSSAVPFCLTSLDGLSPVDKVIRQEHAKRIRWNYSLYPEPDLEQSLIELYFKNIHPCLPLLHPATFIQDLESGLSRKSDSFRALCLAMMAVSSRFSKDARVFIDLDGFTQSSLQAAGIRYAMIVGAYVFQPIISPANIHDLQAILLLVVYLLGTTSADASWDAVGIGLQRAQETGAHLEESTNWSTSPIQDHLRRKVFLLLYEFDCFLSIAIGKPPFMQKSNFDVLPHDLDFEIAIGTFKNPFDPPPTSNQSDRAQEEIKIRNDVCLAYWTLKSSIGRLKNVFPLMDVMMMNARKDSYPGVKFLSRVELVISQLDTSMTDCYTKIAKKFSVHESSNANVTDSELISSVNAVTWYHEFRLLTRKVLFGCKGSKNNARGDARPTSSTSNNKQEELSKITAVNPHAKICIESAKMIISLINRLHERNLLELGFYWIPLRITNALIILIISLKKFRKTLSQEQRNLRYYEISVGIKILDVLAPTTFLAEKCSKMMRQFQEFVLQRRDGTRNDSSRRSPKKEAGSTSTSSPQEPSSPPSFKYNQLTSSSTRLQDFTFKPFLPVSSSFNASNNNNNNNKVQQHRLNLDHFMSF